MTRLRVDIWRRAVGGVRWGTSATRSRWAVCVAAISALWAIDQPIDAGQARSVLDGIYTDAQATRGRAAYRETCESCHAPDLSGGKVVPEIVGPTFIARWDGQTVGQLFDRVLTSMPEAEPSRVSRRDKAAIVAFILRSNGFPAGAEELADRTERLEQFTFEAVKP